MFKKQLDPGPFNSILNYYFPLCHGLGAFDMEWWVEPKTVTSLRYRSPTLAWER